MSGKGSTRRPGTIPEGAWDAIFKAPPAPPFCPVHRKPLAMCGCMPTDDGPGQAGSNEVKTDYGRRNFEGEGV